MGEGHRPKAGQVMNLVAANLRQGFLEESGLELGLQEPGLEETGRSVRQSSLGCGNGADQA